MMFTANIDVPGKELILMKIKTPKKISLFFLMLLMLWLSVEVISFIFGKYLFGKYLPYTKNFLVYDPDKKIDPGYIKRYFELRDPILGWPSLDFLSEKCDNTGSRPIPSYPEPGNACVSLYGDSFTYGYEVSNEHAWGNILSKLLKCRVANYGVPGYGTDQAYLRFRQAIDEAHINILGIFDDNALRNINQDRGFLSGKSEILFKPRFILKNGILEYIPIPSVTKSEVDEYIHNPQRYLSYEWFLPDSKYGPVTFSFPYGYSLFKVLIHSRTLNRLGGKPNWIQFFKEDHESEAMPLLIEIVRSFNHLAKERGKHPIILIFPSYICLKYWNEKGINLFGPLLSVLQNENIDYVDLTEEISEYIRGNDYGRIFNKRTLLGYIGHYNQEGNELVAEAIYKHLNNHRNYSSLPNITVRSLKTR